MIQPPSVGPIAGATTTAMPYTANAMPRFRGRESIGQNRLLARLQAAAAGALEDAEENQHRQIGRQAAEKRTDREQRDAAHVKALAARSIDESQPLIGSTMAFETR